MSSAKERKRENNNNNERDVCEKAFDETSNLSNKSARFAIFTGRDFLSRGVRFTKSRETR